MKKMKYILLLMAIFLVGCASKYIQPTGGSTAEVTYISRANTFDLQIFIFDSYECKRPAMIKSFSKKAEDQQVVITVPAGRPIINTYRSAHFGGFVTNFYYTTTEFTPLSNEKYVVILSGNDFVQPEILRKTTTGFEVEGSVRKPERVCRW